MNTYGDHGSTGKFAGSTLKNIEYYNKETARDTVKKYLGSKKYFK